MVGDGDRAANIKLGKRIGSIRNARGMSQDALAAALKVSKSTVHKYEYGQAVVPAVILKRVATALSVLVADLLNGDDSEALPAMTPAVGRLVHNIMSLDDLVRESVVVTAETHIEQIKKIRRIRAARAAGDR